MDITQWSDLSITLLLIWISVSFIIIYPYLDDIQHAVLDRDLGFGVGLPKTWCTGWSLLHALSYFVLAYHFCWVHPVVWQSLGWLWEGIECVMGQYVMKSPVYWYGRTSDLFWNATGLVLAYAVKHWLFRKEKFPSSTFRPLND